MVDGGVVVGAWSVPWCFGRLLLIRDSLLGLGRLESAG